MYSRTFFWKRTLKKIPENVYKGFFGEAQFVAPVAATSIDQATFRDKNWTVIARRNGGDFLRHFNFGRNIFVGGVSETEASQFALSPAEYVPFLGQRQNVLVARGDLDDVMRKQKFQKSSKLRNFISKIFIELL